MEKTLREHLREAGIARWKNKSMEEKKAHALMMVEARNTKKRNGLAVGAVSQEKTNETTSTGAN